MDPAQSQSKIPRPGAGGDAARALLAPGGMLLLRLDRAVVAVPRAAFGRGILPRRAQSRATPGSPAADGKVTASTRNQPINALLFLHSQVLPPPLEIHCCITPFSPQSITPRICQSTNPTAARRPSVSAVIPRSCGSPVDTCRERCGTQWRSGSSR